MPDGANPDQAFALAQAMLHGMEDAAVLVDGTGVVVATNTTASQRWPGLVPGRHLTVSLRSPDLVQALDDVLRREPRVITELSERVPVERTYRVTLTALGTGSAPRSPAAMLVFRDLTEARRLEMMRVDFIANASHELRTPLASLLGFIDTLLGPARQDERARERFLGIMRTQAERMSRLIGDLLSLSRIELNEHRQPEALINLNTVAQQMADTMRPLAADRGVALTLTPAQYPLPVHGDSDDLLRVVENLVENAVKYGKDGGAVELSLRREDSFAGPMAVLSVRDFGPGIAPEHLPRLTERFYRVDAAESRNKGGTGLGLAIVKHVVNRHRGRLVIESVPGAGATFSVMIPLAASEPASS